MNDMAGPQVVK